MQLKFPSLQMFIGVCVGVVSVLFFQHFTGAFVVNREAAALAIEGTFAPTSPHTASTGIGKRSEIIQTVLNPGIFLSHSNPDIVFIGLW